MKNYLIIASMALVVLIAGCGPDQVDRRTSDQKQHDDQEALLKEGTAQTGMPNIKNFRERKLLKDILEMRDQDGLVTYTYMFAENPGKVCFLGDSIGYGIPYATQYTNPQKVEWGQHSNGGWYENILPQADPNGLFSPASAEGTWILMKDPESKEVRPQYIEPRIITLTYKLKGAASCVGGVTP